VFGHAHSVSLGTSAKGEREYEASFNKGCIRLSLQWRQIIVLGACAAWTKAQEFNVGALIKRTYLRLLLN
jgi:hypothetical protein